jgi:creatinine amidohydrolase
MQNPTSQDSFAARTGSRVRLAELTSAEASLRLAANPVLLLPLGSQEDQGPHAPMGDHLSAERIAVLIAECARDAGTDTLVAPVLPFGGRDFFGSVAGGISLSQETLRHVLRDMTGCLLRHGARRLIVVNGHGGNAQAIHDVTQEILLARDVLVPNFQLWRIAGGLLPELLGPERAARAAGHGADPLCSVAMHLFPDLIRHERIPPAPMAPRDLFGLAAGQFGTGMFAGVEIGLPVEISPGGITGDARMSSPETGARLTRRLTELGASLIAGLLRHGWGERKG